MMGEEFKKVLLFTTGLVIGSVVTWRVVKGKYEQYANDEIRTMREYFNQKDEEEMIEAETVVVEKNKPNIMEYTAKLDESGYTNYSNISKEETEEPEEEEAEGITVISPDEFGEFEDYDTISLTYYSDGYVTDDEDILMTNDEVEEAIGWISLTHMGEYEPDALHVRNDIRKVDYEILQVQDKYQEE